MSRKQSHALIMSKTPPPPVHPQYTMVSQCTTRIPWYLSAPLVLHGIPVYPDIPWCTASVQPCIPWYTPVYQVPRPHYEDLPRNLPAANPDLRMAPVFSFLQYGANIWSDKQSRCHSTSDPVAEIFEDKEIIPPPALPVCDPRMWSF